MSSIYCRSTKRIIETRRQAAIKITNLTRTMRVISAGLLSKFRLAKSKLPKKINTSSWANNITNMLIEKKGRPADLSVSWFIIVITSEKSRIRICESGFRRFRISEMDSAFIPSNVRFFI